MLPKQANFGEHTKCSPIFIYGFSKLSVVIAKSIATKQFGKNI